MTLARLAIAELVGTAFLVAAVVGSGIAAERLSPDDVGLQLLENSIATGAVLVALILALRPVSASFNPVVTLADRFLGVITTATAAALIVVQVAGGLLGVTVANLMFDLDAVSVSTQERGGSGQLLGEVVATIGLVLVVFGTLRSDRPETVAFAVGGYIAAAYWFTSSTSFANPAVTIARMLSDTFAGIAPASVPAFIGAELIGALFAIALVRWLYPRIGEFDDQNLAPGTQEPPMTTDDHAPQVVFACVRNGGRSVISRVLTEHYARGAVTALSAGTQPGEHIHAEVAAVLEKLGLDTSRERPTLLTRDAIASSDVAITLGCGEECPYVPGVRYVDWPVQDPAGQDESAVRAIVADLDARVRDLLVELVPGIALPPSVVH